MCQLHCLALESNGVQSILSKSEQVRISHAPGNGTRLQGLYGVRNVRCRVCKYTRKVQTERLRVLTRDPGAAHALVQPLALSTGQARSGASARAA